VPIFVLTHAPDEADVPPGSARFVTDVVDCAEQAKSAAGDRAVINLGIQRCELELVRRLEARDVTHLRYRVAR